MTDRLTPERRSWLMSQVRGWNTALEIIVRRLLFREEYHFRIHRNDLPGIMVMGWTAPSHYRNSIVERLSTAPSVKAHSKLQSQVDDAGQIMF